MQSQYPSAASAFKEASTNDYLNIWCPNIYLLSCKNYHDNNSKIKKQSEDTNLGTNQSQENKTTKNNESTTNSEHMRNKTMNNLGKKSCCCRIGEYNNI